MPGQQESESDDGLDAIPTADVRKLVRLVGECARVPGGLVAQKRHLIEGLGALIGADSWMWNVMRVTEDGQLIAVSILHNLSEKQLALLAEENYSSPQNPYNQATLALVREHSRCSRRIEDMVDVDQVSAHLYTSRPEINLGQSIFSYHRLESEEDLVSAIGVHRRYGAEPFTAHELRMAHILFTEVDWLHQSIPEEDGSITASLSPRLQTVLTLLIDGQSAKEIANHLALSHHTVRGYVKDIYKHYGIQSRSELMRRFMVGDGRDRMGAS